MTANFQNEPDYETWFNAAYDAVQNIADMPNKDIALMVKFCFQNEGHLGESKRDRFPRLRDEQVTRMEAAIQDVMEAASFNRLIAPEAKATAQSAA